MQNLDDIIKIDCMGDICPIPIMRIQSKLSQIQNGITYMLITDHSCALTSVEDFCKEHKLTCLPTEVMNGVWEIIISK